MGLEGLTGKEHEGTFWRSGNVLYLDWGGGYTLWRDVKALSFGPFL